MAQIDLIESLQTLIATPSVSSIDPAIDQSNRSIIDLLANWAEDLGAKVTILPVLNRPEKFNLIACFGNGEGGLVLSGHTDTVPCDETCWQCDPFKLLEKEDRLYGLGIADMKCFFSLVLDTIAKLDLKRLQHPVYLVATADEESSMSGAISLLNDPIQLGRFAVIGEPTGLRPVYLHKGVMLESILLLGKTGHASDPTLGISAIEGMKDVMGAIQRWRSELQTHYHDARFALPSPTLNFGVIQGGESPNQISAQCELVIDIRLLPGMAPEKTRQELRECVTARVKNTGLDVKYQVMLAGVEGLYTSPESEIVTQAARLSGIEPGAVAFATEGPFFNKMGMDTIILGPGDIEQAHRENEYININRIQPMLHILAGLVDRFCYAEQ